MITSIFRQREILTLWDLGTMTILKRFGRRRPMWDRMAFRD